MSSLLDQIQSDNNFKSLSARGKRLFLAETLDRDPDFMSLEPKNQARFRNELQNQFPDDQPKPVIIKNNDPLIIKNTFNRTSMELKRIYSNSSRLVTS